MISILSLDTASSLLRDRLAILNYLTLQIKARAGDEAKARIKRLNRRLVL